MTINIDSQKKIDQFPQLCRKNGLKVTPQRMAVYGMLAGTTSHPTPEEVYSMVRESTPSISLATVYKILDLFCAKGFVHKVSTQGQVSRYDARVDTHHHLICISCGIMEDISPGSFKGDGVQLPDSKEFRVLDYEIQFHGLCRKCVS